MAQIWQFTAQDPYEAMQAGMEQARKNRLGDIDVAEKVRAYEASKVLNELYNKMVDPATGQIDRNRLYGGMAARGYGGMIPGLQTAQAELEAKQAKAFQDRASGAKALSDVEAASIKANRDALAPVNNQAGWDAWRARAKQQYRDVPNIDQVFDQIVPPKYTLENKLNALQLADTFLPKGEVRQIGGATATIDPYTGKQIGESIADVPLPEDVYKQKVGTAAAGAAQTRVQAYTPASETLQVEAVKELRDTYKQLKTAPVDIANLRKAAELATSEGRKYMGTGGQAFLSAAKFLKNRLNVEIDPKAISDAEVARSALFQNVLNNLRKLDAQPSQQQQQIMQEALGSLDTDPDALPRVVQIYEDVIRGRVEQHNREVQQVKEKGITMPYDLAIKLPERAATPEQKPAPGAAAPASGRFKITVVTPPRS